MLDPSRMAGRWGRGRALAFLGRDRTRHRIDRPAGPANPYEAWIFAACILSGLATLARIARPSAIEEAVPPAFRLAWAGLLTAGAGAALLGLYWPGNPFTGVYLKRAGIIALAGALLAYGAALFTLGHAGVVSSLLTLGLGCASLVRVQQITVSAATTAERLRELEAFTDADLTLHDPGDCPDDPDDPDDVEGAGGAGEPV